MKISITTSDKKMVAVDIYSEEGLRVLTELWTKASFQKRIMYEPTWLGVPIIQYPNDIVMLQELIWKLRPDVVLETGVAHGGTAILYASILELLGKGRVIGVDIEIRKYNLLAIKSHPLSKRIELIEGSSIDPDVVSMIREKVPTGSTVLVTLDSNHSYSHVLAEMELYSDFVSPGGYMVVMDGIQRTLWDTPDGNKDWAEDNPLNAIEFFLDNHPEWEQDEYYNRTHITCNPQGYLKRKEED